jgi:hypothetical protein
MKMLYGENTKSCDCDFRCTKPPFQLMASSKMPKTRALLRSRSNLVACGENFRLAGIYCSAFSRLILASRWAKVSLRQNIDVFLGIGLFFSPKIMSLGLFSRDLIDGKDVCYRDLNQRQEKLLFLSVCLS